MGQPQKTIAAEQQILSLGRVLQSLREEDDVDVLIQIIISYLQEQFDYKLIWIALYDRLNHVLFGKGGIIPSKDTSFLHQKIVISPGDLLEQIVIEQHPLGVADLRAETRAAEWQKIAEKFQIQGTIVIPIRYKDRCLGLLLLGSERWGYLLAGEAKARLMMVLGELGAVLYQHEIQLQQKQAKRTDEPLLELLENLRNLTKLNQKLEAAVQATHKFVSPNRTNIYWFEREGRYFWCRMSNQLVKIDPNSSTQPAAGMTVQELSDFYYALSVNQIVSIGDARSSLKSHFTAKLLQRLKVRSLLAAPIIWQKNLLGFLAVESNEPRIWTETDKNFVQGAAGLISLIVPNENSESTIKQIQEDAELTSQVAQGIYSEYELQETLQISAKKVLTRFAATRFLLLQYDSEQNNYQFIYQSQPHNRRPLKFAFDTLKELDGQLLQRSNEAVEIENLDEDLRFFNWRALLLENGMRSLLICKCLQGQIPPVILIIAHESHRCWTTQEKELLWAVSQQIGVIVRQWQLHNRTQHQQKISQAFERCLQILPQSYNRKIEAGKKDLESTVLEQIATILNCPLAVLFSWSAGDDWAEIIPGVTASSQFGIFAGASISTRNEALIQWALDTEGYLALKVDDLPPETRKWLNTPDKGQIFIMALRTNTEHETTAVVLLADTQERHWSEQSLNTTATLISQLAWWRRQKQINQLLESTTEELRQLNWYKHRRLEEIQRITAVSLNQIRDLGIPGNELAQMRYQLLLRQLDHTATSMSGLLKLEQWQLHKSWETMPIASLLKRSLERIDNLLKQQKLWIGVHGLGQPIEDGESPKSCLLSKNVPNANAQPAMAIAGDIMKIELVIHELLINACNRSPIGGRIDIWCRRLTDHQSADAKKNPSELRLDSGVRVGTGHQTFLELSITHNGAIEPQLLTELNKNPLKDVLAPSSLNQPPGLHLLICQNLMQELGGELNFYQLPDNRVVSRLLLPLASNDS